MQGYYRFFIIIGYFCQIPELTVSSCIIKNRTSNLYITIFLILFGDKINLPTLRKNSNFHIIAPAFEMIIHNILHQPCDIIGTIANNGIPDTEVFKKYFFPYLKKTLSFYIPSSGTIYDESLLHVTNIRLYSGNTCGNTLRFQIISYFLSSKDFANIIGKIKK